MIIIEEFGNLQIQWLVNHQEDGSFACKYAYHVICDEVNVFLSLIACIVAEFVSRLHIQSMLTLYKKVIRIFVNLYLITIEHLGHM